MRINQHRAETVAVLLTLIVLGVSLAQAAQEWRPKPYAAGDTTRNAAQLKIPITETCDPVASFTSLAGKVEYRHVVLDNGLHAYVECELIAIAEPPPPVLPPVPPPVTVGSPYSLRLALDATRANHAPLDGASVSGSRWVFTTPNTDVRQVRFWVDNPFMNTPPTRIDDASMFDLGAASGGAWDSRVMSDGPHTLTVAVDRTDDKTHILRATFTVANTTAEATRRLYHAWKPHPGASPPIARYESWAGPDMDSLKLASTVATDITATWVDAPLTTRCAKVRACNADGCSPLSEGSCL